MGITLRPYQEKFASDIGQAFRRYRRVCGVAPTGAGKTVVFSYMAKGAAAKGNDVLITVHRARIVQQISSTLRAQGIRHGRIQRGYTPTDDVVQVGMIMTVVNRIARIKPPKFIIVDEGHHAVSAAYLKLFAAFPQAKVLIVTATPGRLDGRGLKEVADVLVEGPSVRELIEIGALAPFVYMAPPQLADLSNVRSRGGDYAADELAEAMNKVVITGSAIDHYRRYVDGETAVVFCANVQHAKDVAEEFCAAGISAVSVDGKLGDDVVDERLDGVGCGKYKVITSCELISEGVDVPNLRSAFLLIRTKSIVKFRQAVGRALRPKSDGGPAWIFDHVGNYMLHGLPDADIEWSLEGQRKKKSNVVETVTCEACPKVFRKFPGWQATHQPCEDVEGRCALLERPGDARGAGARRPPEQQDGDLRVVETAPWAPRGVSILNAQGEDFKRLVRAARTKEQLQEIARIRGMKHGWVRHIMKARGNYAAA